MNINTQTIARQTVCPGRLQFPIFLFVSCCCCCLFCCCFLFSFYIIYFFFFLLSLSEEVFLTAVCAFERQTKFVKSWVFPFAFSASTFFSLPCGQKRLNYLTRMRRGSNNRETPKRVPSSKNNRQLVTCRPFRDSCMRTKPNSYRHGSYRLGRVYRQGSKTLFHAYGPRARMHGSKVDALPPR